MAQIGTSKWPLLAYMHYHKIPTPEKPEGDVKLVGVDDWFIYVHDQKGHIFYRSTEIMPEWLDIPHRLHKEEKAVEKFMLPYFQAHWEDPCIKNHWRPCYGDKDEMLVIPEIYYPYTESVDELVSLFPKNIRKIGFTDLLWAKDTLWECTLDFGVDLIFKRGPTLLDAAKETIKAMLEYFKEQEEDDKAEIRAEKRISAAAKKIKRSRE